MPGNIVPADDADKGRLGVIVGTKKPLTVIAERGVFGKNHQYL